MQSYRFKPEGVCAKEISFDIDGGNLYNVHFVGGCPGNTAAVGKLLEGTSAERAVQILKGNLCGNKRTSCADQLARGVEKALESAGKSA